MTEREAEIPYLPNDLPEPDSARPNWREAARLLAQGLAPDQVGARLGIRRQQMWRQLRRSRRLQLWIQLERLRVQEAAALQIEGLRADLPDLLRRHLRDGNARLLHWLAGHLRLGELPTSYFLAQQISWRSRTAEPRASARLTARSRAS